MIPFSYSCGVTCNVGIWIHRIIYKHRRFRRFRRPQMFKEC